MFKIFLSKKNLTHYELLKNSKKHTQPSVIANLKFISSVNSSFSKEFFSQLLLSLFRKAFPNHPVESGCLITILLACLIFFKELNTDVFLCICLLYLIRPEYKFLEKETLSV